MKKLLIILVLILTNSNVLAVECNSATECRIFGRTFIAQKQYKEAIESFDKAIMMNPSEYWSYAYRAKSKYYLKDYDGVFADTEKSIEIQPNSVAYGIRASTKLVKGDYRGAYDDASSAIVLNPDYMKCYEVRARASVNLEDYVGALKDACRAISLRKDYPKNYEVKALAEYGLKDYKSAKRDFEKSAELYKNLEDMKNYRLMIKMAKNCRKFIKE